MQSLVLTEFWKLNYGVPPTAAQLEWLSEMSHMEPTAVLRWYSYRNSQSYRRRTKVRRWVTHGDRGGGQATSGAGESKIKPNAEAGKKTTTGGGHNARRNTIVVL